MSGIGKHQFSKASQNIYDPPVAICPYCGCEDCHAEHADVGIGLVQCGPYFCPSCKAHEVGEHDNKELKEKEIETGWYLPGEPLSDLIPQANGKPIPHTEAKSMLRAGINSVPFNNGSPGFLDINKEAQ